MAQKVSKTNAMRALEQRRIAYETFTYPPEIHSADVVAETLSRHQIRRVPVVDGEVLVGVISQADVARDLAAAETGEVVKEISKD